MKTSLMTEQLLQADWAMPETSIRAIHQVEHVTLGHGDMTFEVARAVESSPFSHPTLSPDEANELKNDRPNGIAIASELIWMFGGIAVLKGESQLVSSWQEVEELLEENDLVFDIFSLHFQESRYESILLFNTTVGSALIPPLWEIRFYRLLPVGGSKDYQVTPIDCVVEIRTGQCLARLAPEYSKPFCYDELIVEG